MPEIAQTPSKGLVPSALAVTSLQWLWKSTLRYLLVMQDILRSRLWLKSTGCTALHLLKFEIAEHAASWAVTKTLIICSI